MPILKGRGRLDYYGIPALLFNFIHEIFLEDAQSIGWPENIDPFLFVVFKFFYLLTNISCF